MNLIKYVNCREISVALIDTLDEREVSFLKMQQILVSKRQKEIPLVMQATESTELLHTKLPSHSVWKVAVLERNYCISLSITILDNG